MTGPLDELGASESGRTVSLNPRPKGTRSR